MPHHYRPTECDNPNPTKETNGLSIMKTVHLNFNISTNRFWRDSIVTEERMMLLPDTWKSLLMKDTVLTSPWFLDVQPMKLPSPNCSNFLLLIQDHSENYKCLQ